MIHASIPIETPFLMSTKIFHTDYLNKRVYEAPWEEGKE